MTYPPLNIKLGTLRIPEMKRARKNARPLLQKPLSSTSQVLSVYHTPRASIMMLYCFNLIPGILLLSSHHKRSYFKVFSASFVDQLSTRGQLIPSAVKDLVSWLIILASTLFAPTSVFSAHTATSKKSLTSLLIEELGLNLQGGTLDTSFRSFSSSKKNHDSCVVSA